MGPNLIDPTDDILKVMGHVARKNCIQIHVDILFTYLAIKRHFIIKKAK